ncbi:MAG: transposase [Bdellovibrionales bacterium]
MAKPCDCKPGCHCQEAAGRYYLWESPTEGCYAPNLLKDPRKNTKKWWITKQHTYGGALNYRKLPRPFAKDKLVHGVFKADIRGGLRFTKHEKTVREILAQVSRRYGVRIKDVAINFNHIHLLWYSRSKEAHTRFIRLFAAELGRYYARLRRQYRIKPGPLWQARPFTRLVSWGRRSLEAVARYIRKNRDEVLGFVSYQNRQHRLNAFLVAWDEHMRLASG